MPRINVYLPEELAAAARPAEVNLSRLLQEALRERLGARRLDAWLDRLWLTAEPGLKRAPRAPGGGGG